MDAFCGSERSTRSSGRSDDGKNCRGMRGSARNDATNSAMVAAIVSQRTRMAKLRNARKARKTKRGSELVPGAGGFRIAAPSTGAKMIATNQDAINAMATTAKREKVYSPAELAAKPTGMNPAIVTSVPASMAKA